MNARRTAELLEEWREARRRKGEAHAAYLETVAEEKRKVREARAAYEKAAAALEAIAWEMDTGKPREPLFAAGAERS